MDSHQNNGSAPRVNAEEDPIMSALLGAEDPRAQFNGNTLPEKTLPAATTANLGLETYRSVGVASALQATSLFGAAGPLTGPHAASATAGGKSAWGSSSGVGNATPWAQANQKQPASAAWMGGLAADTQPFNTPKLQPFNQEDTVTQFESSKPSEEIYSNLLRAMRETECMYSADREAGTIKLTSFLDHSRVSATVRVFSKSSGKHLVHYGRNFGDRIPATRLFFTIANASGLVQLALPRLLRRSAKRECCMPKREGAEEKAAAPTSASSYTPAATTVFVDMLSSPFVEEALVGAQGLARACCCRTAAKPYVEYLSTIATALRQHQDSGCGGHLVSRDIVTCLAAVLAKVAAVAVSGQQAEKAVQTAGAMVEHMLQIAATPKGDAVCARASVKAVASLCNTHDAIKRFVLSEQRALVDEALTGCGPCAVESESAPFLQSACQRLRNVLEIK